MSEKKEHSKEVQEVRGLQKLRNVIVLTIFLFVYSLGIPLWQKTTTIYRADLPTERIEFLSSNLKDMIRLKVPVVLDVPNSLTNFVTSLQDSLDSRIAEKYPAVADMWSVKATRKNISKENHPYNVKLDYAPSIDLNGKEVFELYYISPFSRDVRLTITDRVIGRKEVIKFVSDVILNQIFDEEIMQMEHLAKNNFDGDNHLMMPYSPNYNILFSLFVENGRPIDWDIEQSEAFLNPVFDKLKHFANFTVSSQVQYFSSLAISPVFDSEKGSYIIEEQDLPTFINFGDWNLDDNDIKPTINFIVYLPKCAYEGKELFIEKSETNSFLIPQWGGVYIYNKKFEDDEPFINEEEILGIMEIFTSQLFSILGMPKQPASPFLKIDALSRVMAIKNVHKSLETLKALVALANSLHEISVPKLTKQKVEKALEYIDLSVQNLNSGNFQVALELSSQALECSNSAFFEKEMVQQAYFPNEHKLAVFLPLIGPASAIIVLGLIKAIKSFKKLNTLKK